MEARAEEEEQEEQEEQEQEEDITREAPGVNILTAVRLSVDEDQRSLASPEAARAGVTGGWSNRWDCSSGLSQTAARG